MTAKEKFEQLGYIQIENNEEEIKYRRECLGQASDYIYFELRHKRYGAYFRELGYFMCLSISLEEYKAITQQLKELGWLDE